MKTPSCLLLELVLVLVLVPTLNNAQQYVTNSVNERAVPCPDDPNQIGYKHVIDINVDQRTELTRITNGEAPRKPYVFPFCNRFKFLMEEEVLEVLLDEITFVCGYNGENSELCVLEGGSNQVNVPQNQNTNVIFQGLSFRAFTGNSVQAYGATNSKITFNDVKFQDFLETATAVHQSNPAGGIPMTVEINKVAFATGVGGNLIDNIAGSLTITDLDVQPGVDAQAVVRTSEGGTTTVNTFTATESNIVRITHTLSRGQQTLNNLSVTQMASMGSAMFAEGAGTRLTATTVSVTNNKLLEAYNLKTSRNLNVLVATDGAIATLNSVTVTDNTGVDRGFSANSGAQVSVIDATFSNNVGTSPPDLLSNVVMSEDGGSMNVLRLQASNLEAFSAVYFTTCGSTIQVMNSCVSNSRLSANAFVSFDSTFSGFGNFIDINNVVTTTCRDDKSALVFKESTLESSCFSATGTGLCEGSCVNGFNDAGGSCSATGGSLTPSPAPGTPGPNDSCPASPPTPIPTLPPGASGPGDVSVSVGGTTGSATEQPGFTATIPPDGGGLTTNGGNSGGGTENFGGSNSDGEGENNVDGSTGGEGGSAASSASTLAAFLFTAVVQYVL